MQLTFTPRAARKLQGIMADKGGGLALRIRVRSSITGVKWEMSLEPASPDVILVNGVPVQADLQSRSHLDGLIIDWIQTPAGAGFGVYDRSLSQRDLKLGAD